MFDLKFLFIICVYVPGSSRVESIHYACPPLSVCLPRRDCPAGNITFGLGDPHADQHSYKFICGVLDETEGYVCCNDPIAEAAKFHPTTSHWFYKPGNTAVAEEQNLIKVIPYPGLETDAVYEKDDESNPYRLCPPASVCSPASYCPPEHIKFSSGLSEKKFVCGNNSETVGHVCCYVLAIGKPPVHDKQHFSEYIFMRGTEESLEDDSYYMDVHYLGAGRGKEAPRAVAEAKPYHKIQPRSGSYEEAASDKACGRTLGLSGELHRIYSPIGDRDAKEGDFPWHVAILSKNREYMCSGSLIGHKTVLTIAHCFDKIHHKSDIIVRVGDLDLQYETEKNPAFDVAVSSIVVHPKYDSHKLKYDIAIIELEESTHSLVHVRPVCLPSAKHISAINKCKVSGWGQFSKSREEKVEISSRLRSASFFVIPNAQCQKSLRTAKELGPFFKLQKGVLCAKGYSNSDTCKGDGGSGLVCRSEDAYVIKGLVSYGLGCGYNLPGVYTDVEYHLKFINNYKHYLNSTRRQHAPKYQTHNNEDSYDETDEHILYKHSVPRPINVHNQPIGNNYGHHQPKVNNEYSQTHEQSFTDYYGVNEHDGRYGYDHDDLDNEDPRDIYEENIYESISPPKPAIIPSYEDTYSHPPLDSGNGYKSDAHKFTNEYEIHESNADYHRNSNQYYDEPLYDTQNLHSHNQPPHMYADEYTNVHRHTTEYPHLHDSYYSPEYKGEYSTADRGDNYQYIDDFEHTAPPNHMHDTYSPEYNQEHPGRDFADELHDSSSYYGPTDNYDAYNDYSAYNQFENKDFYSPDHDTPATEDHHSIYNFKGSNDYGAANANIYSEPNIYQNHGYDDSINEEKNNYNDIYTSNLDNKLDSHFNNPIYYEDINKNP